MNAKNVLCPVDFSEYGDAALSYASTLAKDGDGTLHIVHVYDDSIPYETGFGGYVPAPADLASIEQQLLTVKPSDGSVPCKHQLIEGSPADSIVEYAKEHQIDLIVMGTHGRTGLSRLLMGSVAEAVVRGAECPVVTVKQPATAAQEDK